MARDLLPQLEQVLGRNHRVTLMTRHNVAHFTGQSGDKPEALRLFQALMPDWEQVLGRDHPDTLLSRRNIAHLTGLVNAKREALRLFRALLADQERVLGRDHPHTLDTLGFIALWTLEDGNAAEGRQWLHEGRSCAESRFGAEHSITRRFLDKIRHLDCDKPEADTPIMPRPR